jgi:hypothetical protein
MGRLGMTSDRKFCPQCGTKRVGFFRFCGKCGLDYESLDVVAPPAAASKPAPPPPRRLRPPRQPTPEPAPAETIAVASVAVPEPTVTSRSRPLRRYAVVGVIGLLGIGAVSNIMSPSTAPVAAPTSSAAYLGSTATARPLSTSTVVTTATPTAEGTVEPTVKVPPRPTPKLIVDQSRYRVVPGGREAFRGAVGRYNFTRVGFSADRSTVRWTATPTASAACRVVWRIDPASGATIKRTVRATAGDAVSGNERYSTTFTNARVLVDSTCPQWVMSIAGQEKPKPTAAPGGGGGGNCDPSYPTVCIPPYPPDLDCGQIAYRRFEVIGSDPHGFDRDNDGIGCESG